MSGVEFTLGVVASLVATGIIVVISAFFSQNVRIVLTAIQGRLLHIDVEQVFANSTEAAAEIRHEIERAKRVDVFCGRGNEMQRTTFASILGQRPFGREKVVRIMLPNPTREGKSDHWIVQRESELAAIDTSFGNGILAEQIRINIRFLATHLGTDDISLRLYSFPHVGRIVITDRAAFFTPYQSHKHGRDCRVFKFRSGGDIYLWLERLFEQLWEASEPCAVLKDE